MKKVQKIKIRTNHPNSTSNNNYEKKRRQQLENLIKQNEEIIKKYEKLKNQTNLLKTKIEIIEKIFEYRGHQIRLINELQNTNSSKISFIPRPKTGAIIKNSYTNTASNINTSSSQPRYINKNKEMYKKLNNSTITTTNNNNNNNVNYSTIRNRKNKAHVKNPSKIIIINHLQKSENSNKNNENNKNNKNNKINKHNLSNSYKALNIINKNQNRNNKNNKNNKVGHLMNSSLFSTSAIKMDSINFGNNKFYFNNSRKNINNSSKIKMNKSSCLKPYKKRHIINKNMKKRIKEFISTQKLPDIDSQLDKNKNNKLKSFLNPDFNFSSNPNFSFKKNIYKKRTAKLIEFYYSYHDFNEIFMAIAEKNILGYNIKIVNFKTKEFKTRLKKHNNRINYIKHFFNIINKHDFLISGDIDLVINVWDISYKYNFNQFKYTIRYKNELYHRIYFNVLPVFVMECDENEKNQKMAQYLLICCKSINIYNLKKGEFIKNINHYEDDDNDDVIINLINWENKENNQNYIINCMEFKILIFNFFDENIFCELSNNKNNNIKYISEGIVNHSTDNNEFLCIINSENKIEIWDLSLLNIKYQIELNNLPSNEKNLMSIINWNSKYLIIGDDQKNLIYVVDVISGKKISNISAANLKNGNETTYVNYIKIRKIMDTKYGESFMIWKNYGNNNIALYASNGYYLCKYNI